MNVLEKIRSLFRAFGDLQAEVRDLRSRLDAAEARIAAPRPAPMAFGTYCEERALLVERERAAAAEVLEAERALRGCEIDRAKAVARRASQVAAQEIATGHRPSGATAPSKAQQSRKAAAEEALSRAESALGEAIEARQALDFAYPAHYARWVSENS